MGTITICGKAADVVCFVQKLYPITGFVNRNEIKDEEIKFMVVNNPPGFIGYYKGTKIYTKYTDNQYSKNSVVEQWMEQ